MHLRRRVLPSLVVTLLLSTSTLEAFTFTDTFTTSPSPHWSNLRGDWYGHDDLYDASSPTNAPPTHSSLPFNFPDFTLDVDINGVSDGGIWIHTDAAARNGLLLVTGGGGWGSGNRGPGAGNSLYFHSVVNDAYSSPLGNVSGVFTPGDNIHLRVTATGDVYNVYLNHAATPVTSITIETFPTGRVGVYDYSPIQTFDNFTVSTAGIPGDADSDGDVDLDDQGIWASNFTGSLEPGTGTSTFGDGDFDADKDVDLDDQGIWAANFTGSLAPALLAVPEPASFIAASGVALVLLLKRGRIRP